MNKKLIDSFIEEMNELLDSLEKDALVLEKNPENIDALNAVFRVLHSVKGTAAMFNFVDVSEFAHGTESVITYYKNNSYPVNSEFIDYILESRDYLRNILSTNPQKNEIKKAELENIKNRLLKQKPTNIESNKEVQEIEQADINNFSGLNIVKINSEKLDVLLNLTGELVAAQKELSRIIEASNDRSFFVINNYIKNLSKELNITAVDLRLIPLETLLLKYRRLVRELSKQLNKEIKYEIYGGDIEIDKSVIDSLYEPLLHLIRNAADHGIEKQEERKKSGKDIEGVIKITVIREGLFVRICVTDDGQGLDIDKIAKTALANGIITKEQEIDNDKIKELIFIPGFSTTESISDISGRGIGLDAVKNSITNMGGSISVDSEIGKGTTFFLKIPLSLVLIDGFLVESGTRKYIIPLSCVDSCFDRKFDKNHGSYISVKDESVLYSPIREIFFEDTDIPENEEIVVVRVDDKKLALSFDKIYGKHQTVIKSIGEIANYTQGVTGATILADGKIALILDVVKLYEKLKR